ERSVCAAGWGRLPYMVSSDQPPGCFAGGKIHHCRLMETENKRMGRFYLGVILGIILNVTGAAPVGWPGAVTAVAQESPATEKSATALISEGYDALSRGDAQTALERLQAGVTKNPEQKEGWLLLGDALSLLGKL